jgi:PAT family beta-lactamase induction signal transducer AmpG
MSALRSRRVQFAGLLMLSSGMPLGFVMNTLQVFLRGAGVSLKTIGLLQIVSVPWAFKFLWAPLVDRFSVPWLGRRRGWIAAMQLALAAALGGLAAYVARHLVPGPSGHEVLTAGAATGVAVLALGIALLSATQDIALDAYTVEVLEADEVGPASGLRIMWYRIGMLAAGALAIFASEWVPWPWVFGSLGAVFAGLVLLTLAAPEPRVVAVAPRTFQEAVVEPFRNFFQRRRAVEVALFLVFYKFGDNLGGSMVNPFLKDLCFSNAEIGLMVKTIGTAATIAGAGAGAALMTRLGIGRALWVFGFAQAGGNLLYALAAATHPGATDVLLCGDASVSALTRAATYVAVAGEYASQGMATSALLAYITRLCDRRYSATQYALLSSLFGLGRTLSGPPSGWMAERLGYESPACSGWGAEHLGYEWFFLCAALLAVPGFLFLQRVAPIQQRDLPEGEIPQA